MPPIYWVNRKSGYYLSSQHETFSFETKYEKFSFVKLKVSASETFGFNDMKLSFRPVGNRQGYLYKTTETDTFRRKSICFGIKT